MTVGKDRLKISRQLLAQGEWLAVLHAHDENVERERRFRRGEELVAWYRRERAAGRL